MPSANEKGTVKPFIFAAGFAALALLWPATASADTTSTILDMESAIDSNILIGADTSALDGMYFDTLATEDTLNQLFGVSETASQTAILGEIPTGAVLPTGDTLPIADTSTFDTTLETIANGDFTNAAGDATGSLSSLGTDLGGLGGLGDLGSLGTDLTGLLSDLTGGIL